MSIVETATSAPVSTRYHALDALRAIAMLLGIVLHAAWIMYPSYLLTPVSDVSGNYVMCYVFHLIHMFRMQVFFLIAGFFACLVLRRNGSRGFIRHRLVRVGFPLLLFWLLLLPWMAFYYVWGGLDSGRLVTDEGFWPTVKSELLGRAASVDLIHLWFLYYLLLLYALTVMLRAVFKIVIDRRGKLRERIDRLFSAVIHSRLNVLWLAIPFQIEVWIAEIPMNWIFKFLIYNLAAIAVLIPSYHYLVRSTFIGKMLNGRKYPFTPWFAGPISQSQ